MKRILLAITASAALLLITGAPSHAAPVKVAPKCTVVNVTTTPIGEKTTITLKTKGTGCAKIAQSADLSYAWVDPSSSDGGVGAVLSTKSQRLGTPVVIDADLANMGVVTSWVLTSRGGKKYIVYGTGIAGESWKLSKSYAAALDAAAEIAPLTRWFPFYGTNDAEVRAHLLVSDSVWRSQILA